MTYWHAEVVRSNLALLTHATYDILTRLYIVPGARRQAPGPAGSPRRADLGQPGRSDVPVLSAAYTAKRPEGRRGHELLHGGLRYRGRPLISVVATERGYSVFPFSPAVVESVVAGFDGFDSTKGGINTDKRRLPDKAFDTLVARRRDEINAALSRPRCR